MGNAKPFQRMPHQVFIYYHFLVRQSELHVDRYTATQTEQYINYKTGKCMMGACDGKTYSKEGTEPSSRCPRKRKYMKTNIAMKVRHDNCSSGIQTKE